MIEEWVIFKEMYVVENKKVYIYFYKMQKDAVKYDR